MRVRTYRQVLFGYSFVIKEVEGKLETYTRRQFSFSGVHTETQYKASATRQNDKQGATEGLDQVADLLASPRRVRELSQHLKKRTSKTQEMQHTPDKIQALPSSDGEGKVSPPPKEAKSTRSRNAHKKGSSSNDVVPTSAAPQPREERKNVPLQASSQASPRNARTSSPLAEEKGHKRSQQKASSSFDGGAPNSRSTDPISGKFGAISRSTDPISGKFGDNRSKGSQKPKDKHKIIKSPVEEQNRKLQLELTRLQMEGVTAEVEIRTSPNPNTRSKTRSQSRAEPSVSTTSQTALTAKNLRTSQRPTASCLANSCSSNSAQSTRSLRTPAQMTTSTRSRGTPSQTASETGTRRRITKSRSAPIAPSLPSQINPAYSRAPNATTNLYKAVPSRAYDKRTHPCKRSVL
jgi:hypothetical protein